MPPSQQIRTRLTELSNQARRLLVAQGLAGFIALVMAASLLLGLSDYWLRIDEAGVRIISFTIWIMVIVGGAGKLVLRPWQRPISFLTAAKWVQRSNPEFTNLTSAVAFIDANQRSSESPELREAVIESASDRLQNIDLNQCIETGPTRMAILRSLFVCLLVLFVCALDLRSSLHAAKRLATPLTGQPWPRWNQLEYVIAPTLAARGSSIEIKVADRNGRLPTTVMLEIWQSSETQSQARQIRMVRDGDVMSHSISNLTKSFHYRVVGGDDHTEVKALTVIEPPQVVELALMLIPPAYTGLPKRFSKGRTIQVLAGTQIEFHAKVNRRLRSVQLKVQNTDRTYDLPIQMLEDGSEFRTPPTSPVQWRANRSMSFSFALIDREQVQAESHSWQIRVSKDAAPTVTISSEEPQLTVTPQLQMPIPIVVKDDIGIRNVQANVASEHAAERSHPLFSAPAKDNVPTWQEMWLFKGRDYNLQPGSTTTIQVIAEDRKPLRGQSSRLQLKVVSVRSFRDLMAHRRSLIATKLRSALTIQQTTRDRINVLAKGMVTGGKINTDELDLLRKSQLSQRQVNAVLVTGPQSAADLTRRLNRDLTDNLLQTTTQRKQLIRLQSQLRQLSTGDLAAGLLHMAKLSKGMHGEQGRSLTKERAQSLRTTLTAAHNSQSKVVSHLQRLVLKFARWESYQQFTREFHRIRETQSSLTNRTARIQSKTIGRKISDLSDDDRGELQSIGNAQARLANRYTTVADQLRNRDTTTSKDALTQATIRAAVELMDQTQVGPMMNQVADSVRTNRVGNARIIQQRIDSALLRILNALTDEAQKGLQQTIPSLNGAGDEIANAIQQHSQISRQFAEVSKKKGAARVSGGKRINQQLMKLQTELQNIAKTIQQNGVDDVAASLRDAIQQIERTKAAIRAGKDQLAKRLIDQTSGMLRAAQGQLSEQIGNVEDEVERAKVQLLQKQIQLILATQIVILKATKDWQKQHQTSGKPTSLKNRRKILAVSTKQKKLVDRVNEALKELPHETVFALYLRKTRKQMQFSAALLNDFRAGKETQNHQQSAIEFLRLIAAATDFHTTKQPRMTSNKQQKKRRKGKQEFHVIGQLKLLLLRQAQLNQRTEKIERLRQQVGETNSVKRQASRLAADQLELITITRQLQQRLQSP